VLFITTAVRTSNPENLSTGWARGPRAYPDILHCEHLTWTGFFFFFFFLQLHFLPIQGPGLLFRSVINLHTCMHSTMFKYTNYSDSRRFVLPSISCSHSAYVTNREKSFLALFDAIPIMLLFLQHHLCICSN
jgi:hypothetical protein